MLCEKKEHKGFLYKNVKRIKKKSYEVKEEE